MRANGTTFHPRSISVYVVTTDLSGMERTQDGPHRVEAGVKTKVVMATRGLLGSLRPPEYHIVSE